MAMTGGCSSAPPLLARSTAPSGIVPPPGSRRWAATDVASAQEVRPELSLAAAPEVALDARQTASLARQEGLEGLREEEREAFLLRAVAGLGYEEIGAVVEATPDAVRMRIYRARVGLRAWLGGSPGTVGVRRETVR